MERRPFAGYGLIAVGTMAWLAVPVALAYGSVRLEPLIGSVPLMALFATGVVAGWLRPNNPSAQRLLLAGTLIAIAVGLSLTLDSWNDLAERPAGWALGAVATFAADLALAALLDLFCSFPDGRYPNEAARLLVRAGYLAAAASALLTVLHSVPPVPFSTVSPNTVTRAPFKGPITETIGALPVLDGFLFLFLPVAVVAMGLRYRSAHGEIRAKLRWPIAGAGVLAVVVVASLTGVIDLLLPLPDTAAQLIWAAAWTALPISLLIGIVRHRLFDLNLTLRRSVTYAALLVLIAVAYTALAAVPGVAAADRLPRTMAVVLTIGAAMAFEPLRRRMQMWADRFVFGDRTAGYALIRQFGTTAEAAVPGTDMAIKLAAVTQQGLGAQWCRVWVLTEDDSRADLAGRAGTVTTCPELHTYLVVAGQLVGRLECGPRDRGHYTDADADVLNTLGRQAALALANARLTEQLTDRVNQLDRQSRELAASRTRIVTAEAAARRQLERDIHDGVQQQLVSLMTTLSIARAQMAAGSDTAEQTLQTMQGQFRQAVADLRDLASGIHPAVLSDQGLVPALEALAARLPLPVTIGCPNGTANLRLSPQREAAAYFAVAEAFTNILKHSGAKRAGVHLTTVGDTLVVDVCDDGHGFDVAATPQRGLGGLRDRLEAIGGSLVINSGPAGPTTIRALVPVGEPYDG